MSNIIIREKDAISINEKILSKFVLEADGYGITWFDEDLNRPAFSRDHFTSSESRVTFINKIRAMEKQNLKMILHFNQFLTGSDCRGNLQPRLIKNVGVLTVEGYTTTIPSSVEEYHANHALKSDAVLMADLFNEYALENGEYAAINIWNGYQRAHFDFLEEIKLVLMMNDGTILNNSPESGIFQNGQKIWFSVFKKPKYDDESVDEENDLYLEELRYKLDRWHMITKDSLTNLLRSEVVKLVEEYPAQMAHLIKYKKAGYSPSALEDLEDDWDESDYVREDTHMKKCFDCGEMIDNKYVTIIPRNQIMLYICDECVSMTQSMVVN